MGNLSQQWKADREEGLQEEYSKLAMKSSFYGKEQALRGQSNLGLNPGFAPVYDIGKVSQLP
jgi:hypothetical protein